MEDRGASESLGCRIVFTSGIYEAGVEGEVNLLTVEVHVFILHIRLSVEVCLLVSGMIDEGVVSLVGHRSVDAVLSLSVDGIEADGVVDALIMLLDGKLERIEGLSCDIRRVFDRIIDALLGNGICLLGHSIAHFTRLKLMTLGFDTVISIVE